MQSGSWRTSPMAQIIVHFCWGSLVLSSSAPLYAAPSAGLPQSALNWVQSGSATLGTAGNTMTVNQASQRAILNWDSFNIAAGNKVQFNQPSISSTALNRIFDAAPSQIFGQLQANGNIYLINPNGIVFGSGAQVNVHGLLASTSTLDLNDNLYKNTGLQQAINSGEAALDGLGNVKDANGKPLAKIEIQNGANISTDSYGQVLVFAPSVTNSGNIATPDGQTVLAASQDKVYIASAGSNADLRGLLVEVKTGGDVSNIGQIIAERGNISMIGLAVNQQGRLRATTSVDLNGSIRLLARDGATPKSNAETTSATKQDKDSLLLGDPSSAVAPATNAYLPIAQHAGTVTFGAKSVTEVAAEELTPEQIRNGVKEKTAVDAQPQYKSRIDVIGKTIDIQSNSHIVAKSGVINVVATTRPDDPYSVSAAAKDGSRIYVGANTDIDVSGENVLLPVERRIVEVELRGSQLKDAPLQRNGVLRSQTVRVDITKGSPLIAADDWASAKAGISKTVKERMTKAGSINMSSAGDVVMSKDATLNVAGGSVSYASGLLNTSKLLSHGRIIDIGVADPNLRYDGIFGAFTEVHPKWGKTVYGEDSVFTVGSYTQGITEGVDGGDLAITSPMLYGFDLATIRASAQVGATQRTLDKAPSGGNISVFLGGDVLNDAVQNVSFAAAEQSEALSIDDSLLVDERQRDVNISSQKLNAIGFGRFTLEANGDVHVAGDAALNLAPFAQLTLKGTGLQIDGRISAPGGAITLETKQPVGSSQTAGNFAVSLNANSLLDVSGSWTNDFLTAQSGIVPSGALALDGGAIKITATGDVNIASGAKLAADGGAQVSSIGKFSGGNGGAITLATKALTDQDLTAKSLRLNGEMSAIGFNKGGKLALTAQDFQLGGSSADAAHSSTVLLNPEFFNRGGFADYALTSNFYGIEVKPDTAIKLGQQSRIAGELQQIKQLTSGTSLDRIGNSAQLPDYLRAPTNLTLQANRNIKVDNSVATGDVRVATGASITGDPGAKITLTSDNSIYVDGTLSAPGGSIALNINANSALAYDPKQALWLGGNANLAARSAYAAQPNAQGLALAKIWDAGTINLTANRGAIIAEKGSVIDVSGASYRRDYVDSGSVSRSAVIHTQTNAAAGSIAFTAAEGMAIYSDLNGAAAGADGRGGSVSFVLDSNNRGDPSNANTNETSTFSYAPLELQLYTQLPNAVLQYGNALPSDLLHKGWIATDTIARGGFASLALGAANQKLKDGAGGAGRIVFKDDVDLHIADRLDLNAANIQVDNRRASLSASSVFIGQTSNDLLAQQTETATAGSGVLNIAGKFIELLGNIGISGAAKTLLDSAGDIRMRSQINVTDARTLAPAKLQAQGDLTLSAAQIYPSTLSDYTVQLTGANDTFAVTGSGATRTPILSAGGKLTVLAPFIDIGVEGDSSGAIAAPLGQIVLGDSDTKNIHIGANGVVDVSANDQLIPFGRLRGGDINWMYPILASAPLLIDGTPEKHVELSAKSIATDAGSKIDLSGGGDIYAFEQVPGPGGSKDFLDAANSNGAFAVIPTLNSPITPYDAIEMAGSGIQTGKIVHLDGGNGLAAGDYAVLPAHYALLPGAYLITPTSAMLAPAQTVRRTDGVPVVSGRFGSAFSGQYNSQWQSFAIESGAAARTRSEYTESTGDKFFADKGVDLAADAGRLVIQAQTDLTLRGSIGSAAQNGRRAQMDIIADAIDVVDQRSDSSGGVQLDAAMLNALDVDSLLLGGRRSRAEDDTNIDVRSNSVTIRDGAHLSAPDIILAARQNVSVEQNASVAATGQSTASTAQFNLVGDGALLRVSSAAQADVARTSSSGSNGVLNIAAGATLSANKSILMDATKDLKTKGSFDLQGGSLNLTANRISLGDGIGAVDGVAFSNADLAAMKAGTLRLSSRSSIDFYSGVNLSNDRSEFNAGTLRNMQSGDAQVRATNVLSLDNTISAVDTAAGGSGGTLSLAAKKIELGNAKDVDKTMALHGFDSVQLGTAGLTQEVVGSGGFTFKTDSNLNVNADRISGSAGADTALLATGSVKLNAAGAGNAALNASELGANLHVSGSSVVQATRIELPSGKLTLAATGANADDNVTLAAGSVSDVSGRSIEFPHARIDTDGGEIHLSSANGNVVAAAGAAVKLNGGDKGGAAGLLQIAATKGQALWQATTNAIAASGFHGGSLQLDVGSLTDLGAWLQRDIAAGIDQLISIRARSGDLQIDNVINAHSVAISADQGKVGLNALIDVSGGDLTGSGAGGSAALYAGTDLELGSNARIDASAKAAGTRGGSVELGARDGGLIFAGGSAITTAGAAGGRDGTVKLRVQRSAGNDSVSVLNSGLSIQGAERIDLDAFKTYDSAVLDDPLLSSMFGEATAFMANEAAIKTAIGGFAAQSNFHLRPEMEVRSSGNLTVATAVNFAADNDFDGKIDWRFGSNAEAPVLTLRAANDIAVSNSITDGYIDDVNFQYVLSMISGSPLRLLLPGISSDYRFVAGADVNAAAPTSAQTGHGNLRISNDADILTGEGDISLFAGSDVIVDSANSAIASLGSTAYREYKVTDAFGFPSGYTEMLPDIGDVDTGGAMSEWAYWLFLTEFKYWQMPDRGGNVAIDAGGSVKLAKTDNFFSDWIQRIAGVVDIRGQLPQSTPVDVTTWGISLADFQQGIAVLGGGNLSVHAGSDVVNLNAAVPVMARALSGGSYRTQIVGGGNLDVRAGGNVVSPLLLVDKGNLEVDAGGYIGAAPNTHDLNAVLALADTQVNLKARGDVVLDAVFNSTVMPQSALQVFDGSALPEAYENYFFTYSDSAKLSVASAAGNIDFNNDKDAFIDAFKSRFAVRGLDGRTFGERGDEGNVLTLYPSSLIANAASGSINFDDNQMLFPSSTGQLTLLAAEDISNSKPRIGLIMSDTPRSLLPSSENPIGNLVVNATQSVIALLTNSRALFTSPIHSDDSSANLIEALNGDIFSDVRMTYTLPKQTWVYAGRDIKDTSFNIQHSRDNEISEIVSGRDFGYALQFNADGTLSSSTGAGVNIDGPGRLDIIAGRNIDLGISDGIQSSGNRNNTALANTGADISLLAGINQVSALSDPVLYNAFADRYLNNTADLKGSFIDWFGAGGFGGDAATLIGVFTGKSYANRDAALADFHILPVSTQQAISLEAYRNARTSITNYSADLIDYVSFDRFAGDITAAVNATLQTNFSSKADAVAAMAKLSAAQQQQIARRALDSAAPIARREFLLSTLNSEVLEGGIEGVNKNVNGYTRGYNAIAAMFPGSNWKGDVSLAFSTVRTLNDGDINLLVPGGKVDVGLAGSFAGLTKQAGDLGIAAQRYGEINGIADGSININQSRIFSLDGGPVTLWSSNGDVDAGRGAKTALSVPPPIIVPQQDGGIKVEYPAAVSGSGIQEARNNRKTALDLGPLDRDMLTSRQRYFRSLFDGNVSIFAPHGVIDAGDAGIRAGGKFFGGAQQIIGSENINAKVAVGLPSESGVSTGTLSLGDTASSATQNATNAMNEAVKNSAAATESSAFVTVDIIGVGS